MSFHLFLSFAIAASILFVNSNSLVLNSSGRIVSGSATHVNTIPYLVSIRRKLCESCAFEQFASGAIYSENIILTTASVVRMEIEQTLMVVAGTSYRTVTEGILYPVEKIIIHENFQERGLDNDVALLRLKVDLPLNKSSNVQALRIAKDLPKVGTFGKIAGWGVTSEGGNYSETIQSAKVPIISRESCQSSYLFSEITDSMLCAGFQNGGIDACKGDAGSPLIVNNEFVGLVSWGVGCARPNNPGVYTNLVHLREWIENASRLE